MLRILRHVALIWTVIRNADNADALLRQCFRGFVATWRTVWSGLLFSDALVDLGSSGAKT